MSSNLNFFREKMPAAVFKHKLLVDYLSAWAPKVNLLNKGNGAAFVDGYAGQGRYDAATPGSPAIAMDVARKGLGKKLQCVFVEKNPEIAGILAQVIRNEGAGLAVNGPLVGDLKDQLDATLSLIGVKPALFFLDPFGTALPRDLITSRILSRQSPSTEVLLNFNIEAVWRMGGVLRLPRARWHSGAQRTIESANQFLGGDWWHQEFAQARQEAEANNTLRPAALAAASVARNYAREVSIASGYQALSVPVRRKPNLEPFFSLMLFYQHPSAKLLFADSAARAHEHWRVDYWERYALENHDDGALFQYDPKQEAKTQTDLLERNVVQYIRERIDEALTKSAWISVHDSLEYLFGPYMGSAYEKNLRRAWKQSQLAIPPDSGKLAMQTIRRYN